MMFSTKDRDNDLSMYSCAWSWKGAWWYNSCYHSNLNGRYFEEGFGEGDGIHWRSWKMDFRLMKETEMKMQHPPQEHK